MIKRFTLIGTFTLVLAAIALPAYAQHISIGIGTPYYPPVAVASAAPYPGYVWQPAHYVWTTFGYQLVPGSWVASPYVVHRRGYVAPFVGTPYYSPYYPPYYSPYYAPRGLSFGFGFNLGHGHHYGHYGHDGHYGNHGRHR